MERKVKRTVKPWVQYSLCVLCGVVLGLGLVCMWLQPAPTTCEVHGTHRTCHKDY